MRARVRTAVERRSFSGVYRRAITLLAAVMLVCVGFVVNAAISSADPTNGTPVTWSQVQCFATTSTSVIAQNQDITVDTVVPNNVTTSASYSALIPGGTATLPSSASGFTITGFTNLNQTYLFRASSGSPQIVSATPSSPTATNNGNPVAYNVTSTNEGNNSTISTAAWASNSGGTITYTTTAAHTFQAGQIVDIVGNGNAGYNFSGVLIAGAPNNTTVSIHGRSLPTTSGSWTGPTNPTLTYNTQVPHQLHVGDTVTVANVTPPRYNGNKVVSAVLSPTSFQAADTSVNNTTNPGPITVQGQVDTLPNPSLIGNPKGTIKSLTTVTNSTPSAQPGTLTTPDTNITMTAPAANGTVTTYGAVVTTTAAVTGLGPAATVCQLPHADPQTDGISATQVGTGGPTTSAYQACRPVGSFCVTHVSPNTGPTSGGTSVTLLGAQFTSATAVNFGTVAATSFTVNNDSSITATAPAQAAGAVDVTVVDGSGVNAVTSTTNVGDLFTYVAPPVVTSLSPSAGTTAGGTSVTITGTGFTGASAVSFGGTAASTFTVNSDTSITATSPAHTAGTVDVTVTTPAGTSATSANDQYTFANGPTISSVSPSAGPTAGGTSVTITGSGFTGATAVSFGGTAAATFTVNNATQITATSPAHAAGTVDITVTTPAGTSPTGASDQFTFVAPPSVTTVNPNAGPTAGGTSVSITGTGFTNASAVSFGGSAASTFTVNSDTSITATSPAHAAGAVDVTVTNPGGTSPTTVNDQFTFVAAPTVTNVSPASGPSTGGTAVTITGTGFTGASAVSFGGTPAASFTVDNATSISATSPAHAAGIVDVTVTTTGGTSATSAADQFTFIGPPTVTSVSPNAGPTAGGTSVTITGSGFTGASAVKFGATNAATFTVNNDTSISATSPAHAAGAVDLTVTTTGGTSATSANDQFTFVAAPTVTNVNPNSGPTAGGTSVTITGTNLSGTSAVSFGGTPAATFTVNNDTSISATSPAEAAGTVDVTVTTAGGTSATSASDQFTFVGAPTVTNVNPNSGPTAGGTSVTITGTNLLGASAVNFGGTPASTFTVNNSIQITATAPAHAAGTVDVTVTTTGGTSATSANDQFTFVVAPTVTNVSPNAGPAAGGTSVTVTGTGFTGASAVSFGGTAASTFTVNNDTSITATAPAHAAGTVDVTVTTAGGTSATSANDQFTFVAAPTVTNVNPNTGPAAGGTSVTITGTNFTGASAVSFGGTAATTFTVNNATTITATSPAHAAGIVDVTVTTAGGTSATSAIDQFTFVVAPTVTDVSPNSGPDTGGTSVTITGTGFTNASAVNFGPTMATTFSVDSDTQITAASPAESAGTVDVTVTTAGGTSATSVADQFTFTSTGGGPTLVGTCTGQVLLATPKPALTDVTQTGVKISGALATVQHTTTKIGGRCDASPRPGDSHIPAPSGDVHPKSETYSLLGNASCAPPATDPNAGNAYPENGKVTWTMSETYVDPVTNLTHSYKIQADIAVLGTGQNGNGPDVEDIQGIVLTGLAPGAIVRGTLWQDPVIKTGGTSGFNTGYVIDSANVAACADATSGNASITKLMIGGGGTSATSLVGSSTEGVKFEINE